MRYEIAIGIYFAGVATGMYISGKAGLGAKIINEIGKLKTKGDNSPIDAEQLQMPAKKKEPFLKRIFTKKSNR